MTILAAFIMPHKSDHGYIWLWLEATLCRRVHGNSQRVSEMQEGLFKESGETAEQSGQPMEEGEHGVGLQGSCQKLSIECIQRSVRVKFLTDGVLSQDGRDQAKCHDFIRANREGNPIFTYRKGFLEFLQ